MQNINEKVAHKKSGPEIKTVHNKTEHNKTVHNKTEELMRHSMNACNTDNPFCVNLNVKARAVTSYILYCQLFIKTKLEIMSFVSPSHMHTSLTKLTIMLTLETIDIVG